jgi:hypothetical protein
MTEHNTGVTDAPPIFGNIWPNERSALTTDTRPATIEVDVKP